MNDIKKRFDAATGGEWKTAGCNNELFLISSEAPRLNTASGKAIDGRAQDGVVGWFRHRGTCLLELTPVANLAVLAREFFPLALKGGTVPTSLFLRVKVALEVIGPDYEVIANPNKRQAVIEVGDKVAGGLGFADESRCKGNIEFFSHLITDTRTLIDAVTPLQVLRHKDGWVVDHEDSSAAQNAGPWRKQEGVWVNSRGEALTDILMPHDKVEGEVFYLNKDHSDLRRANLSVQRTAKTISVRVPRLTFEGLQAEAAQRQVKFDAVVRERLNYEH